MTVYVLGVAPSRHSSGPTDARVPWWDQSPSGQKVHCLTRHMNPHYENASPVWPKAKGRGDRLPRRQCGYDLLRRLTADATPDSVVLVLGLLYWKPILAWLRREGHMAFDGHVPIGVPVTLHGADRTKSLSVQLLPHPRNWPVVGKHHDRASYRADLIGALHRQRLRSGGIRRRPLIAADYHQALTRCGI